MMPCNTAFRGGRRLLSQLALGAGALALWGASSVAQARDVYWSIGVHSPGVSVGVSSAPQVFVHPPSYYVQPAPVYHVRPSPVYVYSPPVVVHPGWGPPRHAKAHGHKRFDRHDRDSRINRRDRDDRHERHGGRRDWP